MDKTLPWRRPEYASVSQVAFDNINWVKPDCCQLFYTFAEHHHEGHARLLLDFSAKRVALQLIKLASVSEDE